MPIVELLFQIIYGASWQLGIPFVLIVAMMTLTPYGKIHEDDATRKQWIGALIQQRGKSRYKQIMGKWLGWVDVRLSKFEMETNQNTVKIAWSRGLISLTMTLAIAYPVMAFVGQWLWGTDLMFDNQLILPFAQLSKRIFVILWIGLVAIQLMLSFRANHKIKIMLYCTTSATLIGGLLLQNWLTETANIIPTLFVTIAITTAAVIQTTFRATILVVAVLILGGEIVTGESEFSDLIQTIVVILILSIAVFYGREFLILLASLLVLSISTEYQNAEPYFYLFAVIPILIARYLDIYFRTPLIQLVFLILLIIVISVSVTILWDARNSILTNYLFTFLAILPAFNALADFASIGLTRYLLRKGLDSLTWREAILDLFGGIIIFMILGCTLITYFHVIRTPDDPILSISGLFKDLKHPSEMWWLAIMLGSTLIPTLLHAAIGISTLCLQRPEWLRKWIIEKLQSNAQTDGWLGSLAITSMTIVSLWIPVLIFYYLFLATHGWLLEAPIAFFRTYAELIGAL